MGIRQQRLADEIRDLVATLFQGGLIEDPGLDGVTITATKLTGDLQICYIYFRLYDSSRIKAAEQGFRRAEGMLKQRLATVLKIRKVPGLKFIFDDSVEHGSNIEQLLDQVKNEE